MNEPALSSRGRVGPDRSLSGWRAVRFAGRRVAVDIGALLLSVLALIVISFPIYLLASALYWIIVWPVEILFSFLA